MRTAPRLVVALSAVAVAGWSAAAVPAAGAPAAAAAAAPVEPNGPALIDAARRGDADAVKTLIEAGADVGVTGGDGSTALLWASHRDDLDIARRLLEAGADVDAANDLGATPLWAASQNGSGALVRLLLAAEADPDLALLSGETPSMVAARAGSADVVEQLAGAGADLDRRGSRGQTALMWAVAQHHADVVAALLAHGADPHVRSDVWSQVMGVPPHGQYGYNREIPHGGNTALLFAARAGDLASARLLVDAGADVNDANAWGVSAVTMAAHSGYRKLVAFLLERGADPDADGAGFAALHEAVMRRDVELAAILLDQGADPNIILRTWTPARRASRDYNFRPSLIGATPFWLAARFGELGLMRLLVAHGADPTFVHHADYIADGSFERRREATTTLMAALGMGGGRRLRAWFPPLPGDPEARALAAVTLAADLGADIRAAGTDDRTALDEAEALQYVSVVEFLVERGAETDDLP